MKLIVGLGNPGQKYEATRHNMGFQVVDELARRWEVPFASNKFQGEYGQGTVAGQKAALLKPQTYMNLSGDSVAPAARFYKVAPEDLIVVHDELDMPLGRLQLKLGGGSGGHNGLNSILERLGSDQFIRVRVGIGKPENTGQEAGGSTRERVVGHVLSGFSKEEATQVREVAARAADAVETILRAGLPRAMNDYNRRS